MSQLYVQTSNVKISGVKDYIDGMCNTGAKFLVFAYHVDMLKAIESVVVKNKVSVVSETRNVQQCLAHAEVTTLFLPFFLSVQLDYIMIIGETPVAERQGLVRHFQKDDKWSVRHSRHFFLVRLHLCFRLILFDSCFCCVLPT
jgi:hypothetical protein